MKAVITVTYREHPATDWEVLFPELQEAFEGDMYSIPYPHPCLGQVELHPKTPCPDLTHDRTVAIAKTIREAFRRAGYDQKKKIHVRVEVTDEVTA